MRVGDLDITREDFQQKSLAEMNPDHIYQSIQDRLARLTTPMPIQEQVQPQLQPVPEGGNE